MEVPRYCLFTRVRGIRILGSSAALAAFATIGARRSGGERVWKGGRTHTLHDHVPCPHGEGNAAVRDGSLPDTLQSVLEDLKPEAVYFSDIEGARGGYLLVNMDDASQIPAVAEPLFLAMDATVQVHPVFTPEDMPRAMEGLQQAAQKYG